MAAATAAAGIEEAVLTPEQEREQAELRRIERTLFLIQRAETLPKPTIGDVMALTEFLIDALTGEQQRAIAATAQNDATGQKTVLALVRALAHDENRLLALGRILLLDRDGELGLTVADLDLAWLTGALAAWAEKIAFSLIIKNVRRVVAAFR